MAALHGAPVVVVVVCRTRQKVTRFLWSNLRVGGIDPCAYRPATLQYIFHVCFCLFFVFFWSPFEFFLPMF